MPCDHYVSVKISEDALNTYGNLYVFCDKTISNLLFSCNGNKGI